QLVDDVVGYVEVAIADAHVQPRLVVAVEVAATGRYETEATGQVGVALPLVAVISGVERFQPGQSRIDQLVEECGHVPGGGDPQGVRVGEDRGRAGGACQGYALGGGEPRACHIGGTRPPPAEGAGGGEAGHASTANQP